MTRNVILTDKEWRALPVALGRALKAFSEKGYGFRTLDRETGKEITEENWFVGVMVQVWDNALNEMNGKDS